MEIERKYLITNLPEDLDAYPFHVIEQAYICTDPVIRIRRQDGEFKKGAQWASVTEAFVDYLLSRENYVRKTFNRTFCPDELYKQTLCWNSGFRNRLPETEDEFEGCRRFIKWENGFLAPIVREDIPAMLGSDRWFARKFSPDDRDTINQVLSSIR